MRVKSLVVLSLILGASSFLTPITAMPVIGPPSIATISKKAVSDFSKLSVEDASLKKQVAISQNKLTLAENKAKLAKITGQSRNSVNTSAIRVLSLMVFGDKRCAELSQGGQVSRVAVGDALPGGFVVSKITKNTVMLNNTTTQASRTLVLESSE